MRWLNSAIIGVGALMIAPEATAQCHTVYYAPAPVVAARPVHTPPVVNYYAPPTSAAYQPANVVYRPASVVYGRPAYTFYSPYGGTEIRVPGQPILNTLRAIVP